MQPNFGGRYPTLAMTKAFRRTSRCAWDLAFRTTKGSAIPTLLSRSPSKRRNKVYGVWVREHLFHSNYVAERLTTSPTMTP